MNDHSDFIASYCNLYEQYFGVPYMFNGGKDGSAVKRLLATRVDMDRILTILTSAFTQTGYPYDAACTIAGFVSVWPVLVAKEAKRNLLSPTIKRPLLSRWDLQRQIDLVKEQIARHPHNPESVHEDRNEVVEVPLETWRRKLNELKQAYALL